MTAVFFAFVLLLPCIAARSLEQHVSLVTRETLFDAITDEAVSALKAVDTIPEDYKEDPLNLTRVMQLSVLSGSVENVAFLLTEYDDARALGVGLRFPEALKPRALRTTDARVKDGDVVALKGICTAALDPSRAEKLADVLIYALYGEPFVTRTCTTEEPPVFDDEGNPDCHVDVILDFIKERTIAAFGETEDMQRIIDANPDITALGKSGADLDTLSVVVRSWPCAYCFETDFCLENAINCPLESPSSPTMAPEAQEVADSIPKINLADAPIADSESNDLEEARRI